MLETSHPPVLYIPPADIADGALTPSAARSTFCEWKGIAVYFDVHGGGRTVTAGAWAYPDPSARFAALRDHVAFYPGRMDACLLDDEVVRAQDGRLLRRVDHGRHHRPVQGPARHARLVSGLSRRRAPASPGPGAPRRAP